MTVYKGFKLPRTIINDKKNRRGGGGGGVEGEDNFNINHENLFESEILL